MNKRKWQKAVNKAIRFVGSTLAIDILFTGKIIKEELDEEELKEYQRLKSILGENVIDYLGSKLLGSISGGGGLPLKTIAKEERLRKEEYKRIRTLSSEELCQEAKVFTEALAKDEEEAAKMRTSF